MKKRIFEKNGHYYNLTTEDDIHSASAIGGGFVHKLDDISELNFVDSIPDTVEEAIFHMEDSPNFKGIHNPHRRWNGWAMPSFHRNVIEKEILPWLMEILPETTFTKQEDGNYAIACEEYPDEPVMVEFDENGFADVGAGHYTWSKL